MATPGKKFPWEEKLVRSGFFVGAVLLHLIVFMLVAGYVIFRPPPPEQPVTFTANFTPKPPEAAPTAPNDSGSTGLPAVKVDGSDSAEPNVPVPVIHSTINVGIEGVGSVGPGDVHGTIGGRPNLKIHGRGLSPNRVQKVRDFELAHRTWENILNHDPAGDYPVYVASYADGDWACNTNLDADGDIVAGSIPNLAAKIEEWTHGEVRAHVVAKPLKIGGPDLVEQNPPFIFFTGHKDFVLTPQEVENLQAYVVSGGAIWGDNAEAGIGSRFDVAFRREMKRVIPSDFQPVATDTDIFKGRFQFDQPPQGMNFLAEPIEHVDIDDKVAILYTPNDYSDLYTMRILPGDEAIQGAVPARDSPLITPGLFLANRHVYFRNFTLPSSLAVQHLGLNIVTYLVTRFDDDLQLAPP